MNSFPAVSVVIYVRNEASYIAQTLESILAQDYPAMEIHVQDGASMDGTAEIARRYPVTVVSEPDRGQGDATNRGFRATRGEIVMFLAGDDLLLPGTVQVVVEALHRHPEAGFAYGDVEVIDASGRQFARLQGQPFDLDEMFWRDIVPTQGVATRRSALAEVGLYREHLLCADWDLWLRLGARYASVYLGRPLARYRVHAGSSSLNQMRLMAHSMRTAAEALVTDPVIIAGLRRGPARALAGSHLWAAALFVLAGEMREAWSLYIQAVRRHPRAAFSLRGAKSLLALLLGPKGYSRVRNRRSGLSPANIASCQTTRL